MIFRLPRLLLLCGVFSTPVFATPTTLLSTTLSNGLKVIVKEDHRSPLVMVQVWYAVGGVDEPKDKLGISHVLEHMMFKGTVRVPNDELKRLNGRYGGSLNAFTTTNHTYYYQIYPKDYLALALELEADRMSGLSLKQPDFSTEIQVVMEERRQRIDDNPQALAFEKFRTAAYPTSPYKQPVIGHMQNLQQITLKDLQQWYNTWYAPNNATVVILGDVNSQQALWQVQRYFGDIRAKPLAQRANLQQPSQIGQRHVNFKLNTQVANLYMAWNVPSLSTTQDPTEVFTLNLIKNLLDGQISSRLNQTLIRDQQKLAAVHVSYDMIQRGDTLFTLTAIPNAQVSLPQAKQAILNSIADLKTKLISDEELTRIRTAALTNFIYQQDTLNGQAELIGSLEASGLSHQWIENFNGYYAKISKQDIQTMAQKYLVDNNLTTLYMQSEQQHNLMNLDDVIPEIENQTPPTVPQPTMTEEQ